MVEQEEYALYKNTTIMEKKWNLQQLQAAVHQTKVFWARVVALGWGSFWYNVGIFHLVVL